MWALSSIGMFLRYPMYEVDSLVYCKPTRTSYYAV